MRVGLDARLAGVGLGIATFLGHLSRALVRRGDVELVWMGPAAAAPDGVEVAAPPGPYPFLDSPLGERWTRRLGLDVVHFAGNTGWPRRARTPAVLTVHDLIYMSTPFRGRSARQAVGHAYLRLNVPRAARAARCVMTPSQTVATEVAARFAGLEPVAIPHGVTAPARMEAPEVPRPYALAFGARDPRKGLGLAVDGWRAAGEPKHLVLLTGAGLPDGFVPGDDVTQLGYQPVEALWGLLRDAEALIYPSRDEGFGLPVVEAMAAGCPVITGLAPVTLEIGGDAVLGIDASDPVASIAAHLRTLDRAAVSRRGLERARAFDWDTCAARHVELYAAAT